MAEQFIIVKSYEEGAKEIKQLLSVLTISPFDGEIVENIDTHEVGVMGKGVIPIFKKYKSNEIQFNKMRVFILILSEILENISKLTDEQLVKIVDFLKENFKGKNVYNILIRFFSTLKKFDKKQHVIVVKTKSSNQYLYNNLFFEKNDVFYLGSVIRANTSYKLFFDWLLCDNMFEIEFRQKSEVLNTINEIIEKHINRYKESMKNIKKKEIADIEIIKTRTTNELKLYNDHINEYKDLLSEF